MLMLVVARETVPSTSQGGRAPWPGRVAAGGLDCSTPSLRPTAGGRLRDVRDLFRLAPVLRDVLFELPNGTNASTFSTMLSTVMFLPRHPRHFP